MAEGRHVRVHALAKLNLSLEVLEKRSDGYHNLRTLFQTISLGDELAIHYQPAGDTRIDIDSDIPDNLVVRAARLVMEELGVTAHVRFQLKKSIPMGAGLGGGSSDAAAVLLSIPALSGKPLGLGRALELAMQLGSDVPFFLIGGTALGLGRGEDLYPVADVRYNFVLATPDLHVSTPEAYKALQRTASFTATRNAAREFLLTGEPSYWTNDFEGPVFGANPRLAELQHAMESAGLQPVRLTGSGSAVFGICANERSMEATRKAIAPVALYPAQAVNRLRYRALWWRQLAPYAAEGTWPPQPR